MEDLERLRAIGDWLGTPWSPEQEQRFVRLAEYLSGEGTNAGGLGPHEAPRMMDRHIGDSLAFLAAILPGHRSVVDIGSGVGLPGIPMAIARPEINVTLVDRSQRRTDLAGRAVRILGLENVTVQTQDVNATKGFWDVTVFRASLGVGEAADAFGRLTTTTGSGVLGVSRRTARPTIPEPPPDVSFDLRAEAGEVLDSPSWLLRMGHL